MKYLLYIALIVVLLAGCDRLVCNDPYIQYEDACCLDEDGNNICDQHELYKEDVKVEVETVEEEPVVVKTYICPDGTEVRNREACFPEPESMDTALPTPKTNNEAGSAIDVIEVSPACVNGRNGGTIHYKLKAVPNNITFQMRRLSQRYEDVFSRKGIYEEWTKFQICYECKGTDISILPNQIYLMRMVFDQTKVFNRTDISNEYIIDTRNKSLFMSKVCSQDKIIIDRWVP